MSGCYTDNSEQCNPELTVGTEVEIAIVERYDMNTTSIDPPANDPLAPQTCGEQLAFALGDTARVRVDRINESGPESCRATVGSILALSLQGNTIDLDDANAVEAGKRGSFSGAIHANASASISGECTGQLLLTLSGFENLPVLDRSFVPASDAQAGCGVDLQPELDSCIDRYVFEYTEYPEK